MQQSEVRIGLDVVIANGRRRCTGVGTITIAAMRIDPVEVVRSEAGVETHRRMTTVKAEFQGWFNGPVYAIAGRLSDEYDLESDDS